jgi:hypothetical protein
MKALFRKLCVQLAFAWSVLKRPSPQPVTFINIRQLLLHLCDYDEVTCQWVMRWLAYPLRNPGAKMAMGIVVNGEQGTGKSLFFSRVAAHLYPTGAGRVMHCSQLHSVFNQWVEHTRLAVVEGAFSKKNAARLKELIGSVSTQVEGKNVKSQTRKNRSNFVFLSGSTEFLPVLEADRRLCVLEAPPPQLRMFYQSVDHEIRNGGVEAFRDYLLHGLDMAGFDETTRPPASAAHRALRDVA